MERVLGAIVLFWIVIVVTTVLCVGAVAMFIPGLVK